MQPLKKLRFTLAALIGLSLSSPLLADEVVTGNTKNVGGKIGVQETKSCPIGERMSGIDLSHDGTSILSMNFRCNKVAMNGQKVKGTSSWTGYTKLSEQPVKTRTNAIRCPEGQFIIGLKAKTESKQIGSTNSKIITEVKLQCNNINPNGQQEGNRSSVSTAITGKSKGTLGHWSNCPDKGIAYAATVSKSLRINSLKFSCKKGTEEKEGS